jgi:2-oxoglutarate ferredoxin oxidoreductase subunit alpha
MSEKILMKGNEALAEAAIQAGCRHYFGYPITPQNEITAYMAKRLPEIGGSFLQAESEVAAINMVYGAAGAGKRVLTSSSSPGISLKVEGISYIAGADLPAVIVNIQRGGPGLGGIQPSQADYFQAVKGGGHGDYKMVVLAPSSVQEMADLTVKAFDLADKYRIPVFIFADGAMGQMMEPVTLNYPEQKVYEKPWALTGTKEKRAKNIVNSLYLVPEQLEEQILARFERYKEIENTESACDEYFMDDAEICVVGYGVAARVARSAVNEARAKGIKAGLLRPVTLWPFPQQQLKKAAEKVKAFICAELSMGQMIEDVRLYSECKKPVHLCARTGGVILTPKEVLNKIEEINYDSTR